MAEQKNLFPALTSFYEHPSTLVLDASDNHSGTWTASAEDDFLYQKLTTYAGKTLIWGCSEFNSSDGLAWMYARAYGADGSAYTVPVDIPNATGAQEVEFTVPADCTVLRLYFRHDYDSDGIDPPATMTLTGAYLYEKVIVESMTTLNFHKVLKDNLPESVTPGTEHVFYTTDGTKVEMFISNKLGGLIQVAGSGGSGAGTESAYTNAYTQAWIDERKAEIKTLARAGRTIVFAVLTDAHVRIEDGDAGRYDRVRDYLMLAEQLPLDYIVCEGDIMSYCQEWGGVYEPRLEKVRRILDTARCPWFCTRGNHDYNCDDNGFEGNENIVDFNSDTADELFVNGLDWHRSITAQMAARTGLEVHFDEKHGLCGYFYVDDVPNRHRMIFCNSEETQEDANGNPYITPAGELDPYISGVETTHQIDWLINHAMDMTGKSGWVVSFHSHTVPYSDKGETDMSEFHGYGGNNANLRTIVKAFQTGTAVTMDYGCIDTSTHAWVEKPISKDFSTQGAVQVIGWFGGHCHDDCYRKVEGLNVNISTCTANAVRSTWADDPTPTKLPPERDALEHAMSVNVFVVNRDTRTVNMVKVGSKRDNAVKTSSDLTFTF